MSTENTTWGKDFASVAAITDFFNSWSDCYENDLRGTPLYSLLEELLPIVFDRTIPVFDIGCGPGSASKHWISIGGTANGCDISPRMLEHALNSGFKDVFLCDLSCPLDLENLPLFKQGVCVGVIGDYTVATTLLPLLFSKVLPSGKFIFTIENTHFKANLDQILALLNQYNCTPLSTVTVSGVNIENETLHYFQFNAL